MEHLCRVPGVIAASPEEGSASGMPWQQLSGYRAFDGLSLGRLPVLVSAGSWRLP